MILYVDSMRYTYSHMITFLKEESVFVMTTLFLVLAGVSLPKQETDSVPEIHTPPAITSSVISQEASAPITITSSTPSTPKITSPTQTTPAPVPVRSSRERDDSDSRSDD
jgi:hypothetical protein